MTRAFDIINIGFNSNTHNDINLGVNKMKRSYEFEDYNEPEEDLWCLLKVGKHDAFKLAEVNNLGSDIIRVTEHWMGEYTYTTDKENVFIIGTSQECAKALQIYEKFVSYQQKRFNGVLMIL